MCVEGPYKRDYRLPFPFPQRLILKIEYTTLHKSSDKMKGWFDAMPLLLNDLGAKVKDQMVLLER